MGWSSSRGIRKLAVMAMLCGGAVGGRADQAAAQDGWSGLLSIEPYAGNIVWAPYLERSSDALAGIRVGLDPGRGIGVRGFYARTLEPGLRSLGTLESYGGELAARLGRNRWLAPILLLGVSSFSDAATPEGQEQNGRWNLHSVHAGGGIRVGLGGPFGLQLMARDHITAVGSEWPWEASSISDLRHNLQLSTGVALGLGGSRAAAPPQPMPVPPRDPIAAGPVRDSAISPVGRLQPAWGDSVVVLPIPAIGELYVRYGEGESRVAGSGGGLDTGQLRTLIRDELRALLPAVQEAPQAPAAPALGAGVDEADLRDMESRIVERLDALITRRIRDETDITRRTLVAEIASQRQQAGVTAPGAAPAAPAPAPPERPAEPLVATIYTGQSVPSPYQLLLGGRADLGPAFNRLRGLRLVPEVALGAGHGGVTFLLTPNLHYQTGSFSVRGTRISPHVGLGLGVLLATGGVAGLSGTEGVLNFGYGATFSVDPRSFFSVGPGTRILLEHQGLDLFHKSRLLLGLQRPF